MQGLNAQSATPLYHQLAEVLLARIHAGEYPPGSRIPSEPALAKTFRIGRPTVRQATDLLVRQHRLERRRGSGTFVVEPPEQVDALSLAGTMASFEKTGLATKTTIVERARSIAVDDADPENPLAGTQAWFLRRVSRVAGTPALLEALWLSTQQFPGLGRIPLAGRSLSQLAQEHFNLRAESADQTFRIIKADAQVAGWLALKRGEPVLQVKRRVHFPNARDAVYSELICRTDQLVFSQTVLAANTAPGPANR